MRSLSGVETYKEHLQQNSQTSNDYEVEQFSNWILKIGDGKLFSLMMVMQILIYQLNC